jgi:glycosyltransferase involved in cell wall biosynthesis
MNILFITLGFYPAIAWGGPVKVVYQDGKELLRRGHNVTIYCTNLLNKKEKLSKKTFEKNIEGMRIVYFNTWNLPWWPGTLGPFWLPGYSQFIEREIMNYDVVHILGYRSFMGLLTTFITQPQGGLPVIVNSFFVKRIYDRLFGRMELKGISAFLALQKGERQQAISMGIPSKCIEILPNGIDTTQIENTPESGIFRQKYNIPPERKLILFLGRINKVKGVDMLVKAFAQLEDLGAQLAIVGPDDGGLVEVNSLIQQFNLSDRVVLPGMVTDAEKLAAFHDCDLFVLPSRYDAFPTTIMEACLAGDPMVITDCCDSADLVKDRVADVVPFDPNAFADAIRRLLTDQERYNRYKSNCQAVMADTFSIQAVIDRLESVYQRVVAEKAKK